MPAKRATSKRSMPCANRTWSRILSGPPCAGDRGCSQVRRQAQPERRWRPVGARRHRRSGRLRDPVRGPSSRLAGRSIPWLRRPRGGDHPRQRLHVPCPGRSHHRPLGDPRRSRNDGAARRNRSAATRAGPARHHQFVAGPAHRMTPRESACHAFGWLAAAEAQCASHRLSARVAGHVGSLSARREARVTKREGRFATPARQIVATPSSRNLTRSAVQPTRVGSWPAGLPSRARQGRPGLGRRRVWSAARPRRFR